MPRTVVELSAAQRQELLALREHAPRAYVRERAAAILKVAAGQAVYQVAASGLLRPRQPETVAGWIGRFLHAGGPGLRVRAGRGRKPAFFPPPRRSCRPAGTHLV